MSIWWPYYEQMKQQNIWSVHITIGTESERERETDRQTDRDRDRQTETDRERQRQTDRDRQRETLMRRLTYFAALSSHDTAELQRTGLEGGKQNTEMVRNGLKQTLSLSGMCSSGAVSTLCFVWKFSCITFHSLIHACIMYISNACNLISIYQ